MTLQLGWKAGVPLLVLGILLVWYITWTVTQSSKQDIIDYEREQRISELEKELVKSGRAATEAESEADMLRDESAENDESLATALRELDAIGKEKTSAAVMAREYRLLKFTVPLLREQLSLKRREAVTLRRQIAFMTASRDIMDQRYDLQSKRLESSQKNKKRAKRLTIVREVVLVTIVGGIGFGLGRI